MDIGLFLYLPIMTSATGNLLEYIFFTHKQVFQLIIWARVNWLDPREIIFFFFRAVSKAYGGSQAGGLVGPPGTAMPDP